jgi:DNA topoisomerase-2
MDDSMDDFSDGASSDFAPPTKTAKAAAKPAPKKAAAPAKPRGRPAGTTAAKPKAKAAPKKKAKAISDDENSDVDMGGDAIEDDESLLADTPKPKKAPAPKKASGKPLADIENESFGMDGSDDVPAAKGKKGAGGASSKYQMVSVPIVSCRCID